MDDERLDELERQIHEAIRYHREQYEREIKPLIDRLVTIQSLRPRRLLVTADQLRAFGQSIFERPSLGDR